MGSSRADECRNGESMAVRMAQELTERGEIYFALSGLVESMNAQSQPAVCGCGLEWSILVNLLNMTQVHHAAERAFEITSFLDRAGLEPFDDYNDDCQVEFLQENCRNGNQDHNQAADNYFMESCSVSSSISSLPALVSDDSSDTNSARGGESTITVAPALLSTNRWNRFRQKRREWKSSVKMFVKSMFRQSTDSASESSSNQYGHQSPVAREVRASTYDQDDDQLDQLQDYLYEVKAPVSEQSTSRSRSGGVWVLSECDILGISETSDATAASYAIMEDRDTQPSIDVNVIEPCHERTMIRFFDSFRFRSHRQVPE